MKKRKTEVQRGAKTHRAGKERSSLTCISARENEGKAMLTLLYRETATCFLEEQIGFPFFVDCTAKILNKGYMRGFSWRACKFYSSFFRGSISLAIVALNTGTHEVFPRFFASSGFRHNVVHCKGWTCCTAVLATAIIPTDDIASR